MRLRPSYLFSPFMLVFVLPAFADDKQSDQAKTFEVPYRLTATQHVLVRAKINGKGPYNFILDTGAPALFVSTAIGKKLDLKAGKGGWATIDKFMLEGGATVSKAKARIEDPYQLEGMNGLGLAGAHLDGIIGYNILARFRIEFDFTKDKLAFTPLNFDPPAPQGLEGGAAAAAGLDTMAAMMKFVGGLLGKKAEPTLTLPGFFGMEVADGNGGVDVKSVLAKGPAEKAGIEAGDQIQQIQGKKVGSAADFRREASKIPGGSSALVAVNRRGEAKEIKIELGRGF